MGLSKMRPPSIRSTASRNSVISERGVAGSSDEASGEALPTEGPAEEVEADEQDGVQPSEGSKLKQLLGLLKRSMGVKDLAAVRLSLPATMLHPMGNLEFWTSIGQSEDPVERLISVLRWSMTKDLKWAKGGVVKPYNSVLGETFRSIWDAKPMTFEKDEPTAYDCLDEDATEKPMSEAGSIKSSASSIRDKPSRRSSQEDLAKKAAALSLTDTSSSKSSGGDSNARTGSTKATSIADSDADGLPRPAGTARVTFLNEQVSHHPPISVFWVECLPAGPGQQRLQSYGVDQISAKFTGTSVKCGPGSTNKGIFVALPDRGGEEYQITHPTANICGLLRGSLYVTIGESSIITQRLNRSGKAKLRAICEYPDESWIGKARYRIEGVIFEVTEDDEASIPSKAKHVPEERIVARFEGNWRGKVVWWRTKGSDTSKRTVVDLTPLLVAPKQVRPMELLSPNESRKLWKDVTQSILDKNFNQATKHKQVIEQLQRDKAKQREEKGEEWKPAFFELDYSDGRPTLNKNGEDAVKADLEGKGYDGSV